MDHRKTKGIPEKKNIHFCFIDYYKALGCVDYSRLRIILKEMGISDHLTCPLRNQYVCQEVAVRNGHGTTDWFKSGKEYVKAVYYSHTAYLTYMQSTSCEMPG